MTTLQTITTIELSSICNLQCKYCVNRLLVKHPARKAGIMTERTFGKTLELLSELCKRGTQREINMNGNGESFLDPELCTRIAKVRNIVGPDRQVSLCTNGLIMNDSIAKRIKDSGVTSVDLSIHSPYHTRRALPILARNGVGGVVNLGAIANSHNWAGQLESEHSIDDRLLPKIQCDPLIEGRGYVQSEGNISPCCYDYRNLGRFGTVFDDNILDINYGAYSLCDTCHQIIPSNLKKVA